MLSSVANRLYWVARYLERAENTARILNVYTNLLLDLPSEAGGAWRHRVRTAGCAEDFSRVRQWPLERSAIRFMTANLDNPSSIQASIHNARENLRTLRDLVPKEAFESANELYLYGNTRLSRATNRSARFAILSEIVERCQQITGLFAGTMSHNEAYQFMRLGRNLERADMTTRIVDVAGELLATEADAISDFDTTLWVNVLRTLSAYQAYRQSVKSRITPVRVLYFLLNDAAFPRSFAHCLGELHTSAAGIPANEPVLTAIDNARRYFLTLSLRDLAREHLHQHMDDLQRELGRVHAAVVATWIAPSTIH